MKTPQSHLRGFRRPRTSALSAPGPAWGTRPSLLGWPCLPGPCRAVACAATRNHRSAVSVLCSRAARPSATWFCFLFFFFLFFEIGSCCYKNVWLVLSPCSLYEHFSDTLFQQTLTAPRTQFLPLLPAVTLPARSASQVPDPGSRPKHRPSVSSRKPINTTLHLIF